MFEASLHTLLLSDSTLSAYLATYDNNPALFSEYAPDDAERPYLVYSISKFPGPDLVIDQFNIYLDLYDYDTSRATARSVVIALEILLAYKTLTSDNRFDTIRLFRGQSSQVHEPDPRSIHYNMQFLGRAGRKAWANSL